MPNVLNSHMGQSAPTAGNVLRGGEFYSPVMRRTQDQLFLVTELSQPCARNIPAHTHDLASILLVLEGSYGETEGRKEMAMSSFSAIFNPALTHHISMMGKSGAHLLTIELRPEMLRNSDDIQLPAAPVLDLGAGPLLWNSVKISLEWKQQQCDLLAIESLLWEMLAALSARPLKTSYPAPWFRRVKEKMAVGFDQPLRMEDLAREAGV